MTTERYPYRKAGSSFEISLKRIEPICYVRGNDTTIDIEPTFLLSSTVLQPSSAATTDSSPPRWSASIWRRGFPGDGTPSWSTGARYRKDGSAPSASRTRGTSA